MNYTNLTYHYRPKKGWINDPNGLVYFQGYYHVFYQHSPNYEVPWKEPMHWGHARTKDFLHWEELPIALYPDTQYDKNGCWSGTAIVKDNVLFLIYSSIRSDDTVTNEQTVSIAYSTNGVDFKKYENNPVIASYPIDGGPDFRDPAVCMVGEQYYCIMATGHPASQKARLLLYKSNDLFHWEYVDVVSEWEQCRYAECPSLVAAENGRYLLTASVCPLEQEHYFSVMYGFFEGNKFKVEYRAEIDKGPDQYAGQVFQDHKGRNLMISWLPGWKYSGYAEKDVGCLSLPKELRFQNGKIYGYPPKELQPLLKDSDECCKRTEDGFIIAREGREPVVCSCKIDELKILRDSYIVEVFVNGGESIYSVLL